MNINIRKIIYKFSFIHNMCIKHVQNKNLKFYRKICKKRKGIAELNLKNKFNAVVKQAKCLRSAIDEHWDSKNILENAREKFNSPELKREVKSKNKNKSLDLEI